MRQPTLFEETRRQGDVDLDQVVLYALGNFQARGKLLANRDLPLDRLRGALRRASEKFNTEELSDEVAVEVLESLGADVRKVPSYVAKHPFRVIVPRDLAARGATAYAEALAGGR